MSNSELIAVLNKFGSEPVTEITSIDTSNEDVLVINAVARLKKLKYYLYSTGKFEYEYVGVKMAKLA